MASDPAKMSLEADRQGVRQRSKQERQRKILLAAREAFAKHGYEAAELRQIARAAGLSAGTIFNYVTDKHDLIYLIFNDEIEELNRKALAAPQPWQTFVEKMVSVTEPYYRLYALDPVLSRILLGEVLRQTPGLHLARWLSIRARFLEGIGTIVAEAKACGEICSPESAEEIARYIYFSFTMALRYWLESSQPDWRTGVQAFERVLRMKMEGLRNVPSPGIELAVPGLSHETAKKSRRAATKNANS